MNAVPKRHMSLGAFTENVKLAVAVRGVIFYDTMHAGDIVITGEPSENPLEGVTETYKDLDCKDELYAYFAPTQTENTPETNE